MSTELNTAELHESRIPDDLKPKWRERFEFFEQYGAPSSPAARAAFKTLPSQKRRLINASWLGFFFGAFYFFALGMWKRGLTWVGIAIGITVLEGVFEYVTGVSIPRPVDFGITVGVAMTTAMTVNYSWYRHRCLGDKGWNPFKGLRW